MINKIMNLEEAVNIVKDGNLVAFGGNVLHRAPMAFVREMARKNIKNLRLLKTAGAQDIDLLCAIGNVESVDAGFVSYETEYGLAAHYRKAVESGKVIANEHACYTVICALRAAAYGVPFMPVAGLKYGDLLKYNDYFKVIKDPFEGEDITLVKAMAPDAAIIHVQECDLNGNARIYGPKFEDVLLSRAAKKVIITTEQIVHESKTKMNSEYIDIPGFLVEAVVHTPKGASPCSCAKKYDLDKNSILKFKQAKTLDEINDYIASYEKSDRSGGRRGIVR